MVRMGEVARPEEAIFSHERDHTGHGALVRITRDPTLPPEVVARLVLERNRLADRRREHGVHPLDPVADPARTDLQDDDAQLGKLVEHSVLKERGEAFADHVAEHHVLKERGVEPGHLAEACGRGPMRLEARVNAERQPELLSRGKDAVVIGMPVDLAAPDERRHPEPLHSVAGRTAQLLFRQIRQPEWNVGDRHEPALRVRAEIDDPAIVRPGIRHRELEVLALRLPQQAERRIEQRALDVLDVQPSEALLGVHRAERGVVDVA